MELHIPTEEAEVYNILSDGCHEIIYQTGACFEWQYPELPGFAIAKFSFRTQAQEVEAVKMIHTLLSRVDPSKAYLVLHGCRRGRPARMIPKFSKIF